MAFTHTVAALIYDINQQIWRYEICPIFKHKKAKKIDEIHCTEEKLGVEELQNKKRRLLFCGFKGV